MSDVILTISPSQMTTFAADEAFGCNRKWFFKSSPAGPKLPDPPGPEAILGTQVHAYIERWFKDIKRPVPTEEPHATIFRSVLPHIERVERRGISWLERPIDFLLPGVPGVRVKGIVDVVWPGGIVDWKTKKNASKGKKDAELRTDRQMLTYALERAMHHQTDCTLEHVTVATEAPYNVKTASTVMTYDEILAAAEERILPVAEEMLKLATEADAAKVPAKKGFHCKYCPFQQQCEGADMSVLKELLARRAAKVDDGAHAPAVPTQPQPPSPVLPPPVHTEARPAAVTPPDAPRARKLVVPDSLKLEQAAEQAMAMAQGAPAGFLPVPPPRDAQPTAPVPTVVAEPPKRGRGRPPGSPNKPKVVFPEAPAEEKPVVLEQSSIAVMPDLKITELSYSLGYKVSLGNYSSIDFSVTMKGETAGSPEVAMESLKRKVKAQVDEELALATEVQGKVGVK